ncbi:MAG: methylated-DNA--[protein]-cysteine S-methyltransferase [Planctomycetes bacterium]|nr:methylated-DNA--[protein]-cysteine S-methyltransferase [Planctomycetota bacterium]
MAIVGRKNRLLYVRFEEPSKASVLSTVRNLLTTDACEDDWNEPLAARLQAYAAGTPDDFRDIAVDYEGWTPFARKVLEFCRRVPCGQTTSYGQLAARAGSPRAARAVGNVMAHNRCPLVIPCHRVLGSGSSLGGYSARGGLKLKRKLLDIEAMEVVAVK